MLRRWLAAHRSLAATATSGSLILAIVAGIAVASGGYEAKRMDLGDGSVWVVNGAQQLVGRANTQVLELNTAVPSSGPDIEVLQAGATVLVVDKGNAKLDLVDAATAAITDSVPLPPDDPEVLLAGQRVVIHARASGEIWLADVSALADFDPASPPALTIGADAVIAADSDGLLAAFSPDERRLYLIDTAAGDAVTERVDVGFGERIGAYQVTTIAGRWAVYDERQASLHTEDGDIPLGPVVAAPGSVALQLPVPAPATGQGPVRNSVLVGHDEGLVDVPLDGSPPRPLVEARSGTPARPLVVDGCRLAAWSDGGAWRECTGAGATEFALQAMPGAPRLSFASNGEQAVLNDTRAGTSWAVQRSGELIDNWDELVDAPRSEQQLEENAGDTPPELEQTQREPVAVDDELGARPGRATVLPVLLNDHDPNGDVLVITDVTPIDEAVGRLDLIASRQQLQLTLEPGAHGTVAFEYGISDGRGGVARASVVVSVREANVNGPPEQRRTTTASVETGGKVSVPVLGDWIDPDGDALYLAAAATAEPDSVSHEPAGSLVFTERGRATGPRSVTVVVSDGQAETAGSVEIMVREVGEVELIADPFVVLAYAGQELTISPLPHVRGGSGGARLNGVPERSGVTVTPSYERGTFTFVSTEVRTHYLEYIVADGDQTATGLVRVEVSAPPDSNTRPITVPKTVFVTTLSSETVEVAASDIDPAGGVLLVTGVVDVPVTAGLRAEVIEQRAVRVTLTGPLEGGSARFGYRISNGLAEAEGEITVIEIPQPARLQPPVAVDDAITVRVGDAVDIPVLGNDSHPDGEEISLLPALVRQVPDGAGLLFASGDVLRYLAPETPGVYTASYEVSGPFGQTAQAQLTITVKEVNAASNNPPVPRTVTARVLAGETVRIDIPLSGVDPDGDSVQLLGQETNPERGAVLEVGPDYIEYQAGEYSAGTDTFSYSVVDGLGARATGTVRVGIAPRPSEARNPVAVEDEVHVRPGHTVTVQVLGNDSDPDGGMLRVTAVEPSSPEVLAEIVDETVVRITPPAVPGGYGLVYTIESGSGGTSSNFITVIVDDNAPLAYPEARDTVLTLGDVLDREFVDVDVLANVFFADGDPGELELAVLSGYGGTASVRADKSIRVRITDESQILPFSVAHPDDASIRSFAFIRVPGYDDALPQLDRTAPPLVVDSEEELRIELNRYVIAVGGKRVRLTDSSTVRATHADGSSLVVDSDTLVFNSEDRYFGPASISFVVTDGASADDPEGRTATLVLPITVTPRENQPPVFGGGVIEFEPGQQKELDLVKLTNYPYPDDIDELAYTVLGAGPQGFDYALEGQRLVLRATEAATKGTVTSISLGVRDGVANGESGRIRLEVVPSTRPLARPLADGAVARRGQSTTIDVLANDEPTNPFPGVPMSVVSIRGLGGGSLPAGVSVTPSADRSRLTVQVSENALPGDTTLQYQLADATGDPERMVWGSVRISVQDVPDRPVAPRRADGGYEQGQLTLQLTPPQFNNSPIVRYEVVSESHGSYRKDCGVVLRCVLTDLDAGSVYQFSVIATNAIGASEAGPPSARLSADYLPAAPAGVRADPSNAAPGGGSIDVSWPAVPDPQPGSRVEGYTVEITGPDLAWSTDVGRGTTALDGTTAGGRMRPDTEYTVTVYARNGAQVLADADWRRSSTVVRTVGPPSPVDPGPQASLDPSRSNGEIRVTWGTSSPNGSNEMRYSVGRVSGAASVPSCVSGRDNKPNQISGNDVSSGWVDTTATDGVRYSYFVYADNGFYCTASASGAVESKRAPGAASGSVSVARHGDGGQYDVRVDELSVSGGIVDHYEMRLGDGTWRVAGPGTWATSAADSSVYGFDVTLVFRACRDDTNRYCGPASDPVSATPIATRAGVPGCVPGTPPSFAAPDNNGAAVNVVYELAYLRPLLPETEPSWGEFGTHSPDEPVPDDATGIRVRATVSNAAGAYTDPVYRESSCEP